MITLKKIHVIINPISGSDFPILPHLVRTLNKHKIDWEISVTKTHADGSTFAKQAIKDNVDAVAVYGGDGTIMDVAAELADTKVPLIIIPGGTANVMAKELGISTDTLTALKIFSKKNPKKRVLDMGICNRQPFMLRMNVGLFADVVKHTSRSRKNSLGQASYVVSALQRIGKSKPSTYKMILDGKHVEMEGIGLTIANSGNVGITGLSLASKIEVDDGFLDVVIMESADVTTFASIIKGVVQKKKPKALTRYKVKEARITVEPKQSVIQDDILIDTARLDISIKPHTLTVLL